MRQIQVCAWLWTAALALVACSGGEFSTGSETSAPSAGSPPALNGDGGEDKGSASGGSRGLSIDGENQSGQAAGGRPSGAAGASSGGPGSAGTTALPPGSGGAGTEDCASGSVTIRMLPSPQLPAGYLCDASCGTGWLTITDAEGATAFSISAACGTASCDTCEVQTCGAAACLPTALASKGTELVWTGTYLAKDTCGKNMACQRQACVKPGKYKARACAPLNQGETEYGCMPQESQLCTEAEFEFPAKEHVVLVLQK